MSLTPADKVRIQQLRDSGALADIFETLRLNWYQSWCTAPDEKRREMIWCKQSGIKDLMREFNKAADGVEDG